MSMNNNRFDSPPPRSNAPPPRSPKGLNEAKLKVLGTVSNVVFLLGTIVLICCCCLRNKRKPKHILLVSNINPTVVSSSPHTNPTFVPSSPHTNPTFVPSSPHTNSTVVNERVVETSQPYLDDIVHVWKGDAATMERFLHDMANEKPIRFTAQQLSSFTNNFSDELGSGGFGVVYQGEFPNRVKIAVKVLNRSTDKRVEEQFMAEVATIGRTYHVNLVRLYGFCFDNGMCALVYEFMENGSLDNILFKENQGIECEKLQEIAIGTVKGLAYLHEECQQRIIHYDIKPGNVLLDVNFSPKVADFGLAKLCSRNNSHVSNSGYRGTPGYSAPEFLLHNYPITHKCDVYSFGMLLFEIVRKRRNTDVGPTDSLDWFPKRVWEEYDQKGGLVEITSIECGIEEKDREKAERMFMVALWCVQDSPQARPSMSTVVRMLEGDVQIMPPLKPFQYLYSIGLANVPSKGSYSSTTGRTDESISTWYKDSTPIMRKYDIHMASSSSSNF